jgi:hypothetical protein
MKDYSEIWTDIYCVLLEGAVGHNPRQVVGMTNEMMRGYMAHLSRVREKYGVASVPLWTRFFISVIGNGYFANSNRNIELADEAMNEYLKNISEIKKLKLIAFA